jgi:hypothetical protein
VPLTE